MKKKRDTFSHSKFGLLSDYKTKLCYLICFCYFCLNGGDILMEKNTYKKQENLRNTWKYTILCLVYNVKLNTILVLTQLFLPYLCDSLLLYEVNI